MAAAGKGQRRPIGGAVPTRVYALPPQEVVQWLDKKAARSFKSRSRFITDLLIAIYRKENPAEDRAA